MSRDITNWNRKSLNLILGWSWTLVLVFLLLRPSGGGDGLELFPHQDKIAHFASFFIFGSLFLLAKVQFISIFYFGLFLAVYTEILQGLFPSLNRSADFFDLIANLFGLVFSYTFSQLYNKLQPVKRIPDSASS